MAEKKPKGSKKEEREEIAEIQQTEQVEELHDPDFQAILKTLLDVYQPILEEELNWAKSPEALIKEAESNPPDCEEEIALADRLFDKFFTEEVAVQLLSPEGREELGPIEEWRWCWRHILCCLKFGWLLRRAKTFRAAAYYLHRYWRCIRQIFDDTGADRELTAAERADLEKLTVALAEVYKPFLNAQLESLASAGHIAAQVIDGEIDCEVGLAEADQIFDNFLTPENAPALFGEEAFEKHRQDRRFWFCRCWCLCAVKFGYCLARANSLLDVLRCLLYFFRCVRRCFRPLLCELTDPQGCVAEEVNTQLPAMVVAVKGTAGGAWFSHYVLEWSSDGVTWHASDFHYPPVPPGGGTQGNNSVFGGLLAYFDVTARDDGLYFIRMTVHSTQGATRVCTIRFSLFKQDVRILGVDNHINLDTNAWDPAAKFVETVPALCSRPAGIHEVSFGRCISIQGSAFVGGCEERKIKRYRIDYKKGCETDPLTPGWMPIGSAGDVEYNTIWQYREMNMRRDTDTLTARWVDDCVIQFLGSCLLSVPDARLAPTCWQTQTGGPCELSGLITLRLTVEDTLANKYYDTQCIWIDNKHPCAVIRIDAVPACADINISQFATPPDCSIPWQLPISGIAYDDYIDDTLPLTRPNDNFDFYWVKVSKQGGTEVQIPVPGPGGACFFGTSRVGHPGAPCDPCNPANPNPAAVFGTLTTFDLRAIDPICSSMVSYPVPSNLLLPRGECCTYIFRLRVQDRTIFPGGPHWREALWPVRIGKDLPPVS